MHLSDKLKGIVLFLGLNLLYKRMEEKRISPTNLLEVEVQPETFLVVGQNELVIEHIKM